LGAKWEGEIITQELYDVEGKNTKFIPIVFNREDIKYIPTEMRGGTYYLLDRDAEYDDLYRHLTDQPKTKKRDLGKLRSLLPKKRKESFLSPSFPDAAQEPGHALPSRTAGDTTHLMLYPVGGNPIFVGAERIRFVGKTLSLSVIPSTPRQAIAIPNLERSRELVGVAYRLTAMLVRVRSVEQIIEQGKEVWHIESELDEYSTSGQVFGNFSMGAYSPDQIAEMRARRILLDENLEDSVGRNLNGLTLQLIENSVAGGYDSKFAITSSPFPALFTQLKAQPDIFLEAARLYAVLLLLLSHAVGSIDRLDLSMRTETELALSFEGTRAPRYVNEPPPRITVAGVCELLKS